MHCTWQLKVKIDWFSNLGMVINKKKTEFIIFGNNGPKINLDFGGELIPYSDSIKILGVQLQSNLKWSSHVNKVIKKINSLSYSLRVLNCVLNRKQHKNIINSHVISQLKYALPIWCANVSYDDNRRLSHYSKLSGFTAVILLIYSLKTVVLFGLY